MLRWGGQFEHLQTASKRLTIVVPVAMLLIFLLLYSTFHSMRLAFLIYTAVPMAATGGVFALFLRGLPFSISAGVGFIALFGVAVLNGLVWVSAVEHLRLEGIEPHAAARGGRGPIAADPDDGPGRRTRIYPHGGCDDTRCRDPAPLGHGRHRWTDYFHAFDNPGATGRLPVVCPKAQGSRELAYGICQIAQYAYRPKEFGGNSVPIGRV